MALLFTSEQVSAGHPDKICDQVSDAILTEFLSRDPNTRAGIECRIKNQHLFIAGEVTTRGVPDVEEIARKTITPLMERGHSVKIHNYLSTQSLDIAMGVDAGGAGDQGMMFGYACRDTDEMMPLPWAMATDALHSLDEVRSIMGETSYLLTDAKSQVSYNRDNHKIDTFLISTQHTAEADMNDVYKMCEAIMLDTCEKYNIDPPKRMLVNPTGRFVMGGPYADAGLTGRKIIADTYGGYCPHGGGAFSGKDPTKVDRSAAYAARKIAKDILRERTDAHECIVQLAYAIGVDEPVSIFVSLDGKPSEELAIQVMRKYDLTPNGIIKDFDLRHFDYNKVSAYGHFGKAGLPWEE